MKPTQNEIVTLAREIYAKKYHKVEPWKGCLYWAAAFEEACKEFGIDDCLIQAGSAQFQFRKDTGANDTHFSYMYDPLTATTRMRHGLMPEIHVWNALKDSQEIVDLTTRYQAQQARDLRGFEWEPEFALPDYFWGKPDNQRMIYMPAMTATLCMLMKLNWMVIPK